MADERIEIDTGTGELLCEIRDRVAAYHAQSTRGAQFDSLITSLPPCVG